MSRRLDETQRSSSTSRRQPPPYRPITPPHRRGSPSRPLHHTSSHRRLGGRNSSSRGDSHVLTCGAEYNLPVARLSIGTSYGSTKKYVVPFLPFPLEDPVSRISQEKQTTGCGTRLHTSVHPGLPGWIGSGEDGGSAIVPLPVEYFTTQQKEELGGVPRKEQCGCITTGIGCCVCGNTLGVQKTRCAAHRVTESHAVIHTFLASAVSPPIPPARKRRIPIDHPRPQPTPRTQPRTPANAAPPRSFTFDMGNWLSENRARPEYEALTQSEMDAMAAQMDAEAEGEEAERAAAEARFHAEVGEVIPSHRQPFRIPTQLHYDGVTLPLPRFTWIPGPPPHRASDTGDDPSDGGTMDFRTPSP
ncbi:hypothetical protein C8R43DRAFT_1243033 [Mycena crocata]|nr:hypothetical protein C8R43DRAFT_1243033 [Mycena crocata]